MVLTNGVPSDTAPSSVGQFDDPNLRSKLEMFCNHYLNLHCCDEHEMAARLAKQFFFFIDPSQHPEHLFQCNSTAQTMDGKKFPVPLHFTHLTTLDDLLHWVKEFGWFPGDFNIVNLTLLREQRQEHYLFIFGKRLKLFLDWREMSERWRWRGCDDGRIDFPRAGNSFSPSEGPFVKWINSETVRVYLQSILDGVLPCENVNCTDLAVSKILKSN